MSVSLGMPAAPPPVLAPRRRSRKIKVGSVDVGGDAPVSVQSMCTTPTTDVNATLQQIAELTAAGCDIVRVACPSQDDAEALPAIARKSQIPVIADIHFQPKYVFAAIDASGFANDTAFEITGPRKSNAPSSPLGIGTVAERRPST